MFEVLVLIPVSDEDGDFFPESAFSLFEEVLLAHFGAFTLRPGTARFPLNITRVYAVWMRSLGDGSVIIAVANFAKGHFFVQAISIEYLGIVEIL